MEEKTPGDEATRSAKGMIFVQNYAVYEYAVVNATQQLIAAANVKSIAFTDARTELLAVALDPEFNSVIDGKECNTWSARAKLLLKAKTIGPILIPELFPGDGSHFRTPQLQTIWDIFGINEPTVPESRLIGHINEMVENRNSIAHGKISPSDVGCRFTISDLEKRITDTEIICTHILSTISAYVSSAGAFVNTIKP